MGGFAAGRNQAGSIRASIVTHTLVVTSWRAFLVTLNDHGPLCHRRLKAYRLTLRGVA